MLMNRPIKRGCMEVYNDYNSNLTNLFFCVKERPLALITELGFLPLNSRDDFEAIQNPAASTFPVRISSLAYTSCGTSISSLAFGYATNYTKVTDNTGRWMAYQFRFNLDSSG